MHGKRRLILTFLLMLAMSAGCLAGDLPEKDKVAPYLQDISMTIQSGRAEGSGVAFSREGHTFVWTAAHVVADLRRTRKVIDPDTGTSRTIVSFDDAKIIKRLVEDGRTVGRLEMDAEVIRYSDSDNGEDLALLRVRKKNFVALSAIFYDGKEIPPIGIPLYAVGSLLGQQGSNSMTSGIMSQHGRMIGKVEYDQTTVVAFPGSSGCGVYKTNGEYIGMLVRGEGKGGGFNLIVPIRRMRAWSKRAGVQWAMDKSVDMPSDEVLRNMPIEDIGAKFKGHGIDSKLFPFLIHHFGPS